VYLLFNYITIMENNIPNNSGGDMNQYMTPGKMMAFGLVQGLLLACTIGFFVLLSMMFGEGGTTLVRGTSDTVQPTPSVQLPTDDAPAEIVVKPVDEKKDHIRGAKNAKVTIIEFSDIECPFCQRFHDTMNQVMEKYGDEVRWVYRHFPLESIHPYARPAAIASECAAEQGKFWEFVDEAFADQSQVSDLKALAKKVGLNSSKFDTCLDSKKYDADVTADMQDGEAAGVQGTPFSIVLGPNGEKIPVNGAQPFGNIEAILSQFIK